MAQVYLAYKYEYLVAHFHRGNKRMWDQVRRITGKSTTTVCGGPDAAELNQHYANISTDPRYETPMVKATVSHANLQFSEYSVSVSYTHLTLPTKRIV